MKKLLRSVSALLLALLMALCLAGWSGSAFAAEGGGTLTMFAAEGGSSRAFIRAAEDFEAATGNKVDIQVYSYADLRDKQILELSGGSSTLDLIVVDGPIWLEELKGYLEPLDSRVEGESYDMSIYVPPYVEMIRSDGALYGLPIRIAPWPMMYRADLLEEIGAEVPATLEELQEVCRQIKEQTGVYGLSLSLKQSNYIVASWLPFLYGFGGNILNADNTAADFNTEAGIASLEMMVSMYREDKTIPESAIDAEMDGVVTAMQQGLAAMTFTYAPYYLDMNNPEMTDFAGSFKVSAATPYSGTSGLSTGVCEISGWSFAINKNSANKDLAWEFLKFAGGAEEQRVLALEANNTPTVQAIFSDPAFLEVYPEGENLLQAAQSARQRPGIASWSQLEDVLMRELSAAINGVKTPAEALADAETDVNNILK